MTQANQKPPHSSCVGKVPFDTHALATAVTKRRHRKGMPARQAYRCVHCSRWHLGTDPTRMRMRKRKAFKEAAHAE